MPPAELLDHLQRDSEACLLLDRRWVSDHSLEVAGLRLVRRGRLSSPQTRSVHFAEVSGCPVRDATGAISTGHVRRLDRFYLPKVPSPVLTAQLFDLIAPLYERLSDIDLNLHVAGALLRLVLENLSGAPQVLDFGCGTGLSAVALGGMSDTPKCVLTGVDLSSSMRTQAERRGVHTLDLQTWRGASAQYDGAIAGFVMHYEVPECDLAKLAAALRPGARFAANILANGRDPCEVSHVLGRNGVHLERTIAQGRGGSIFLYRKYNQ
jgi:SAM-dependent methyltransferase